MPAFPRYAVYYAPEEDDPLWALGSAWLGRDAASGAALPQPEVNGFSTAALAALTGDPRRYGLHATLKAPFHLAEGCGEADFLAAAEGFAAAEAPFDLPGLAVGRLGNFLALLPTEPCLALHEMAERCVRGLDGFRAPPTAAELERRRAEALSPRERDHLRAWGYPYVLDSYRFHITLTDSIADAGLRGDLFDAARAFFGSACARAVPVRGICVFAQAAAGAPFMLIQRLNFKA
ncbi:DUF1045 domain-containing protein [Oleispirillum naphthae]|uniref:DUF1045 domain-containing protein n=1 Tax=Oleispirillum naphthae TaxID=2838853 RepID=UPI0030822E5E